MISHHFNAWALSSEQHVCKCDVICLRINKPGDTSSIMIHPVTSHTDTQYSGLCYWCPFCQAHQWHTMSTTAVSHSSALCSELAALYLTSNTIVQFLPGEHVLGGDWSVVAVENVSLTWHWLEVTVWFTKVCHWVYPRLQAESVVEGGETCFVSTMSLNCSFQDSCSQSVVEGKQDSCTLYEVSNFVLDSVTIQYSTGTGLMGFNRE